MLRCGGSLGAEARGIGVGEMGTQMGTQMGKDSLVRSRAPRKPDKSDVATTKRRAAAVGSDARRGVHSPAPGISILSRSSEWVKQDETR